MSSGIHQRAPSSSTSDALKPFPSYGGNSTTTGAATNTANSNNNNSSSSNNNAIINNNLANVASSNLGNVSRTNTLISTHSTGTSKDYIENSSIISSSSNTNNLSQAISNSSMVYQAEPVKDHRRRRSSSIISHVEPETLEDENDQFLLPNMNATWVDQRGAWIIHIVIIILLKLFYNLLPGVTNEWSWTLTNMTYVIGSYIMFHMIKGTPFDFNGGAFDNLTMWEQINDETLYTPARKFLITVPIALFLVSAHYSHYDFHLFAWNLTLTLLLAVVPKLPVTHRLRIFIPGLTEPAQIK